MQLLKEVLLESIAGVRCILEQVQMWGEIKCIDYNSLEERDGIPALGLLLPTIYTAFLHGVLALATALDVDKRAYATATRGVEGHFSQIRADIGDRLPEDLWIHLSGDTVGPED